MIVRKLAKVAPKEKQNLGILPRLIPVMFGTLE